MESNLMKKHWLKFAVLLALVVAAVGVILTTKILPPSLAGGAGQQLEVLKLPAPELTGGPWINTAEGKTIQLANRRGKVTIVEFWTFSCSNCIANLPAYANWHKQFAAQDVAVIGVHTPETASERVTANVVQRVKQLGITYPILVDQEHANWNRWQVEAWPTVYLVDKQGRLRYRWVGELNYHNAGGEAKLGQMVAQLLQEDIVYHRQ